MATALLLAGLLSAEAPADSGPAADTAWAGRAAAAEAAVSALLAAYEREDVEAVSALLAPDFSTRYERGRPLDAERLRESLAVEFTAFDSIDVEARSTALHDGETGAVRVEVSWSRRARITSTGAEWTRASSRTTVHLVETDSAAWRVRRLEGDVLLGLADPSTGRIEIRAGSIDGTPVDPAEPVVLRDGEVVP